MSLHLLTSSLLYRFLLIVIIIEILILVLVLVLVLVLLPLLFFPLVPSPPSSTFTCDLWSSGIIFTGFCQAYQNTSSQLDTNSTISSEQVALEDTFRLFLGTCATSIVLILFVCCSRVFAASLRVSIIRWKRRWQKARQNKMREEEEEEEAAAEAAAAKMLLNQDEQTSMNVIDEKLTAQVSGRNFGLSWRRSGKGEQDKGKADADKAAGGGDEKEMENCRDLKLAAEGGAEEGQNANEEEEEEEIPVSMALRFPKWELPVLAFLATGLSTSTGMLINAAVSMRCFPLLGFVIVLAACLLFVIWLFSRLRKHFISRPAVWWHRNRLKDAEEGVAAAKHASSRQFRHKCLADYFDALQTSGWWEDAVGIKREGKEEEDVEEGKGKSPSGVPSDYRGDSAEQEKLKVAGEGEGAEESMKRIEEIVRTIVQEAALVPALYLRSREGSENARLCLTFDDFLLTARDRLK